MRTIATSLVILLLSIVIPFASANQDPKSVHPGEALLQQNCLHCHLGSVAKAPPLAMLQELSASSVLQAMESGVMQAQAKSLDSNQRRVLAEFITGKQVGDDTESQLKMCEESKIDLGQPPSVQGWGVDHSNTRFFDESLTTVSIDNINQLQIKWVFDFPNSSRARSQPTVAGNSVFVGSQSGQVYALDRATGCVRWVFKTVSEVRTGIVVSPWQPDESSAEPMAYFGDLTGNVYAVDARTGQLVWRDRPDAHPSLTITAAPALVAGKLYVAMSSLEVVAAAASDYECCTFRGGVVAYNATNGERAWVSYTIPQPAEVVGANAVGTPTWAASGAPVWGTPVVDLARGQLYVGTGESYSSPAAATSDALIAMALNDGEQRWHYQATPGDAWNISCETADRINCPEEDGPDYDFGSATLLATGLENGDLLIGGQKSGVVHAVNPDTGELVWKNKLGRGGIQGGVHFGMTLAGDTLYVPMSDFYGGPRWPGEAFPGMFAVDVATGQRRWFNKTEDLCDGSEFCDPGLSAAASAIVGGVVGGSMDGRMRAYRQDTGQVAWEFNALRDFTTVAGRIARGGSFSGASGPVFDRGMMFMTSGYGMYNHMPGNVLVAFELEEDISQ